MGIRIHKVLGYGTQDMSTDLGITERQLSTALSKPFVEYVRFVEDFLAKNKTGIGTEYLGAMLHRFECSTVQSENAFSNEVEWVKEKYEHTMYKFCSHDSEFGQKNTIVFCPIAKLYRRDDDLDFNEYHVRYGNDDYEPKIDLLNRMIYPWSYMMKRDAKEPWGIETYFPPPLYLDKSGEAEKHIPYVPYNIKLMLDFIAKKDMIDAYMKLKPMIYTYWS